jgi:hypothetical protein
MEWENREMGLRKGGGNVGSEVRFCEKIRSGNGKVKWEGPMWQRKWSNEK